MIVALRRRRDFARLAVDGQIRSAGALRLRRLVDEQGPVVHLAFAIPRSVGPAVTRNRLRRQLREIWRSLDRDGAIRPGWYLMIVTPQAVSLNFASLRSSVVAVVGAGGA